MRGPIIFISIVLAFLAGLLALPTAEGQPRREEPRVTLVHATDWSRDGVYIFTDQGGCQYVVVARYQSITVTPRMVRSNALSGGREQAGCR